MCNWGSGYWNAGDGEWIEMEISFASRHPTDIYPEQAATRP